MLPNLATSVRSEKNTDLYEKASLGLLRSFAHQSHTCLMLCFLCQRGKTHSGLRGCVEIRFWSCWLCGLLLGASCGGGKSIPLAPLHLPWLSRCQGPASCLSLLMCSKAGQWGSTLDKTRDPRLGLGLGIKGFQKG